MLGCDFKASYKVYSTDLELNKKINSAVFAIHEVGSKAVCLQKEM